MKIILLKDVDTLGEEGEVKDVSEGHARNFLIPQKLAVVATIEALRELEERKKKKEKAAVAALQEVERLAEELDGFELEIQAKASETGTLFAAITAQKIAETLLEKGFTVDKKYLQLENPIKEVGEYDVRLTLPEGLEATVHLVVTKTT